MACLGAVLGMAGVVCDRKEGTVSGNLRSYVAKQSRKVRMRSRKVTVL